MAIDRIPGVGPQNSDIATAVAAPSAATIASTIATTPAVSSQITASVPTAAAIATAVAAPSLASITSAITTNAASAGVTLAAIGTQVANNAPSPNAWTLITSTTLVYSASSFTFSSIGGYRKYRMLIPWVSIQGGGASVLLIRINGDTGGWYSSRGMYTTGATPGAWNEVATSFRPFGSLTTTSDGAFNMLFEIENATQAGTKMAFWRAGTTSAAGTAGSVGSGGYQTTTASVTSISLTHNAGGLLGGSNTVYLYGAN